MKEQLARWGKEMAEFHLPRWDELPDLELYMDQVLTLVDNYLALLFRDEKHQLLTKSMVNNYVKLQMIPAPVKKRYNKTHIAFLIAITLLKQVLTIPEIKEGIIFQGRVDGIREAYNLFCKEQEDAFQVVACQAQGKSVADSFSEVISPNYLAVKGATYSLALKLLTEKVIELEILTMKEEESDNEQA